LAAGLAEGLEVIHAVGVAHRDLKPSNVLLADDGPRIIDFGISRTANASGLTRTGWVTGSLGVHQRVPGPAHPRARSGFIVTPGRLGYPIELYGPDTGWSAMRASVWAGLLQTFRPGG
jgi:serine/threonine protein kinase